MNEMQNFTTLIVNMLKKEKLFAIQGGPVILAQIENEYGNVMSSYGDAGKAYIAWCSNMADFLHIRVPWLMCQQTNAPAPMFVVRPKGGLGYISLWWPTMQMIQTSERQEKHKSRETRLLGEYCLLLLGWELWHLLLYISTSTVV